MKKTASNGSSEQPVFNELMQSLEKIVTTLEQGQLPLEQALQQFEQGVTLSRQTQQLLQTAEQKVALVIEEQGKIVSQPLNDVGE